MANANIKLDLKGVDQTAAAFQSIQWRAKATSAKMRAMLGGALAAAGTWLSLSAVKSGVEELGNLSDIAMRTSTNVDELTQATTALNILGINGNIDSLSRAFAYMEKNTGRSGLQGFYDTIDEIGKIPDVSKRSEAAMKAFGRSGLDFMPLVNAARDGTNALQDVVAVMPAIPQAAADAGDGVADAMTIMANGTKSIWLQGIAAICNLFGDDYVGGVREAAAMAAAWLEYYAKVAVRKCSEWLNKILDPIRTAGNFIGGFIGSEGNAAQRLESAIAITRELSQEREQERAEEKAAWDERQARWREQYEKRKEMIKNLQSNYDQAAISTKTRENIDLKSMMDNDKAPRTPQMRNELVMGGSNEANRLAILGPQLQNDSKRQIALLNKIEQNTRDVADNTEENAGEVYVTIN